MFVEGKLPAYTSHWTQHRYQMISMIPLIPAALAFPHPALDLALCGSLVLHSYWYVLSPASGPAVVWTTFSKVEFDVFYTVRNVVAAR